MFSRKHKSVGSVDTDFPFHRNGSVLCWKKNNREPEAKRGKTMKKYAVIVVGLLQLTCAVPGFAKTHKDVFDVPCSALWPALKDTLRNSGKYGIVGIDNAEMTASYIIGGTLGGKRLNSVVLNSNGNSCEMQVQTAYSGIEHNDAGDLEKRVKQSLDKLQERPEKPTASDK
jgi:hypothetical protein